jgi:hypothetical protein
MKTINELLGHSLIKVNVHGLIEKDKISLQEKLISLGCQWGVGHTTPRNFQEEVHWYYIGCEHTIGKLGFDITYKPSNNTFKVAQEMTYDNLLRKLNMTFTKSDLKDGMIVVK